MSNISLKGDDWDLTAAKNLQKEKSRTRFAMTFLWFFICVFGVITLSLATVVIASTFKDEKTTLDGVKDIALALASILSGPLGFIIGYYFKDKDV
jgi:nicotinamide riboside transporter PnuC